jgi:1,4-alpha-glucan branching enzyme
MERDWGYSIRHYYSLKHSYGSPRDLKQFIDECHGRQIRVILDGVYTFSNTNCPLLQIDRDYWVRYFYTVKNIPKQNSKNIRSLTRNHDLASFFCVNPYLVKD